MLVVNVWFCFVLFSFKGDYDVVINDYEKAKSLFGKTEVQVFKKCKIWVPLFACLPPPPTPPHLEAKKHIVV